MATSCFHAYTVGIKPLDLYIHSFRIIRSFLNGFCRDCASHKRPNTHLPYSLSHIPLFFKSLSFGYLTSTFSHFIFLQSYFSFLPSLYMSVYPLDGARVEDTLGLKICHYQYRWEETFSNGENAGLIPPPRLTKQDMVSIIRQGPVLQYRQWSHFDREWLLRNLGRRFFWIDPCQNLRLGNKTSQGITQQDLMCADPFWKSFCPTKQRSEFSEPTYFASVPDLMWAQPTPFHLIGHTISYLPKLSQALSSILSVRFASI